jgi:hypothetical protein
VLKNSTWRAKSSRHDRHESTLRRVALQSARRAVSNLRRTVRKFGAELRRKYRAEIERNPARFKRRAVSLLQRSFSSRPGRPCSHPVTRAFRLRARKIPWLKIYRVCLPPHAGERERYNLRVAVRMRRLRRKRRRTDGVTIRQGLFLLNSSELFSSLRA